MIQLQALTNKINKDLEGKYGEQRGVLSTTTHTFNTQGYIKEKVVSIPCEANLEIENGAKLEMFKNSFKYQYRDLIKNKVEEIHVEKANPKAVKKAFKKYYRNKLFKGDINYADRLIVYLHSTQNVVYYELTGIKENKFGWALPEYTCVSAHTTGKRIATQCI